MTRIGTGACACLLIQAFWASAATAAVPAKAKEAAPSRDLPMTSMDAKHRDLAQFVLDKTSFSARGPVEVFHGKPKQYLWLLDNPHRAVRAWRKLGAKCVDIVSQDRGQIQLDR